jgi:hypothetical protein
MKRSILVWSCCAVLWGACGGETGTPGAPDGGAGPSDGGTTPPETLTVRGKVLGVTGEPATTMSVLIPGGGRQVVRVDGSGAFSISGVTPPYELIVADPARRFAAVYQGLTLASPTLAPEFDSEAPRRGATVKGGITGTVDVASRMRFFLGGSGANGSGRAESATGGVLNYSLDAEWRGVPSVPATLYALQVEASDDYAPPTSYLAFGLRDVTLTDYGALSQQDFSLRPVGNATLGGSITVPTGHRLLSSTLLLSPKPGSEFELFGDTSAQGTFNYVVPDIGQSTFALSVYATETPETEDRVELIYVKRGLTARTSASLTLPTTVRPLQPANEATGLTRASGFSWSAFPGGVHRLLVVQDDDATETPYALSVFTTGTQATLPDLSPFGISVPASAEFYWYVDGVGPAASVDDLVKLVEGGNPRLRGTGDYVTSRTRRPRAFTTSATP